MGKPGRNERRKIRATFWNNLAVACVIAGFLAPYFTIISSETALVSTREALLTWTFLYEWRDTVHLWSPPFVGLTVGAAFHALANLCLANIED